jgi:hypothetical protein
MIPVVIAVSTLQLGQTIPPVGIIRNIVFNDMTFHDRYYEERDVNASENIDIVAQLEIGGQIARKYKRKDFCGGTNKVLDLGNILPLCLLKYHEVVLKFNKEIYVTGVSFEDVEMNIDFGEGLFKVAEGMAKEVTKDDSLTTI